MRDSVQLKEFVKDSIDQLPEDALREVAQLVDNLLDQLQTSEVKGAHTPPQGTVADLLACVGIWQFEPGEMEEILQDIERSRLMELEEDDFILD
jgi:hypothetical protein